MRRIWIVAAMVLAANAGVAGTAPKGCYEKTWSKAELKKLPLQQVTAIRLEANVTKPPESKPQAYGRLLARFRQTGDAWLATTFECSDTEQVLPVPATATEQSSFYPAAATCRCCHLMPLVSSAATVGRHHKR